MATNLTQIEINKQAFVAVVKLIPRFLTPVFYWLTMAGDVFILLFFFTDFCKKNSQYRKPYYILLVTGFSIHFVDNIFYKHLRILLQDQLKVPYYTTYINVRITYFFSFYTVWNAVLFLNKFTALWFPLKHDKIWTKYFNMIMLFMLLSPFLPLIYTFSDPNCISPDFYFYNGQLIFDTCNNRVNIGYLIPQMFGFILITFSIVLVVIFHRKTITSFSPQIAKIEKRLMLQALISLIFYGIYRVIELIGFHMCRIVGDCSNKYGDDYYIVNYLHLALRDPISFVPYLIDISLLIVISNLFRKDFFNFYTFGVYEELLRRPLFFKTAIVETALTRS